VNANNITATTMDVEESQMDTGSRPRQCFITVHTRRFAAPLAQSTIELCPSMDLLTLRQQQPQQQQREHPRRSVAPLWLHRSLTFQKLATISNDDESSQVEIPALGNGESPGSINATAWKPDGRWIAVTDSEARLTLLNVEALVKESNLSTSTVFGGTSSSSFAPSSSYRVGMAGNAVRIEMTTPTFVCGLAWAHVGQWHPTLVQRDQDEELDQEDSTDEDDEEDQIDVSHLFEKIRLRYADRSSTLLPPSEYYSQHNGGNGGNSSSHVQSHHHSAGHVPSANSVVPSSQTPLNVIVVTMEGGQVECYLNGRYRVASGLTFHRPDQQATVRKTQISCSNDLTCILVAAIPDDGTDESTKEDAKVSTHCSSCYTMLSIPSLAEQRFSWQTLSTLYSSIMGHFHSLPPLLTEVVEAWKTSLKPLDMKIDGLARLLRNYGLLPAPSPAGDSATMAPVIRKQLVRYILSGHTAGSADLSNAMDQFFTGVQMNDQLVQRMERSLTVAIANVESALRKTISGAQALALESDELRGLARASSELIPSLPAMELQEQCQSLLITLESALTSLVDARFRLRDWVAWLRAAGSQIKARGTAANSVQRENAKKRRVPDDTVRRILRYLQEEESSVPVSDNPKAKSTSTSEVLLGITFSQHWDSDSDNSSAFHFGMQPSSPKSVLSTPLLIPSIPVAYRNASKSAQTLFAFPPSALANYIRRFDFELVSTTARKEGALAITSRLGAGGLVDEDLVVDENEPVGFFNPTIVGEDDNVDNDSKRFRQWALSCHAVEEETPGSGSDSKPGVSTLIVIRAVPLPWRSISTSRQWNDEDQISFNFYLQSVCRFPAGHKVQQLVFRGADGENVTGMERSQALLAMVSHECADDGSHVRELWQIKYDKTEWVRGNLKQKEGDNLTTVSFEAPSVFQDPIQIVATVGGDLEEEGVMQCRAREMGRFDSAEAATRLVVSGLRGVAAVTSNQANGAFLEVFDLDEDEEVEVDVEEEEEM